MKWQAIIVLLTIAFSIVVPPSLSLTLAQDGQAAIGILDVCHSTTPALSSQGDMPCMNERPIKPLPLAQTHSAFVANTPFKPYVTAFQDERPPKH